MAEVPSDVGLLPVGLEWTAVEEEGEVEGNKVSDDECDGSVDGVEEAVGDCSPDEAAVEEEDGDFGHAGGPHVEDFYSHHRLLGAC